MGGPPPPPPPPPPPFGSSAAGEDVPAWKKQIKATKEAKAASGAPSNQPPGPPGPPEMPGALAGAMKKDKKPFTYLPGGLDLSEIRSPKMQRRIMANQQEAPPPPSCTGQQVLLQPQQVGNQFDRLNLGDSSTNNQPQQGMPPGQPQGGRPCPDDPKQYGQSRSFRVLQKMTGGDDETDSALPAQSGVRREPEEETRFTGLRRPDNPIPSRAFHALQKMTSGQEEGQPERYQNEGGQEQPPEEGPVDIRYRGGFIPGKSFKMLQEMTGMNEDGTPTGPMVPSVLQQNRQQQQRKPNLHLSINSNQQQQQQQPMARQFPQPQMPASQQQAEEAPKMYAGGRIPSQSFRILQAMTGESQGEDGTDM